MIAAKDIDDEDSLWQWLTEWPKSKDMDEDAAAKVAISITHRIALQGFPLVWKWFSGKEAIEHDLSALPFLRCF
ncbi:hypothetical protein [Planktotalea sp.]|uniref:hypothetical protein n=1 Tax=Planktotalea sp. TaxID=2029877 RepID=UPI0032982315